MSLPLQGFTVVAIEQAVAAPLATRNLADLGARVIKVERIDGGDFARGYDHVVARHRRAFRLAQPWQGVDRGRPQVRGGVFDRAPSDRPCRRLRPEPRPRGCGPSGFGRRRIAFAAARTRHGRDIRIRGRRPVRAAQGLRHADPGGGRPDLDHRYPGPARQDRDPDRRHRVGDVRRPGGSGRAAAPVAHRRGRDDRRVDARRDGRVDGPRPLHADVHRRSATADGPEPHARSRPTTPTPPATARC